MSTLNTRKDRDRNGKAKLHNHSGIPTLTGKLRFAVAQMIDANVIG